ncbi:hypothetical protein E2C01_001368 [Portunus trituberculatus]|uniref:Uncharacterized protein n=1 Tax=Portunus trituberculatus TaxID=210409 RepID=A0A5B7CK89_PORTR|nr:hypothetical protein [Portunus trituberculatus]
MLWKLGGTVLQTFSLRTARYASIPLSKDKCEIVNRGLLLIRIDASENQHIAPKPELGLSESKNNFYHLNFQIVTLSRPQVPDAFRRFPDGASTLRKSDPYKEGTST